MTSLLERVVRYAQFVLLGSIALVAAAEIGSAVFYVWHNGPTRPPLLGGPALPKMRSDIGSLGFDPYNLYSNSDVPANEGLYARLDLSLPEKKAGEYRIFLVGSSSVAGIRMPPGERISDYLEKALATAKPGVKVYNFGIPSFVSFNEFRLIASRLVHAGPDMIILMNGFNDVFYGSLLKDWRPGMSDVALHFRRRFYEDIQLQMTLKERFFFLLEGGSFAYWLSVNWSRGPVEADRPAARNARQVAEAIAKSREVECSKPVSAMHQPSPTFRDRAAMNEPALDAYLLNAAATRAIVEANGIAFVHVLQPTPAAKQKLWPCERHGLDTIDTLYPGINEIMRASYKRIREIMAARKAPQGGFLDLGGMTDNSALYLYSDYIHEYRAGPLTRLVGEAIAGHVRAQVAR